MQLPEMVPVRQHFAADVVHDPVAEVGRLLAAADLGAAIRPGDRIAVAAGSRGIAHIAAITAAVVAAIREAGGRPFILPAMGSHGGANPDGQRQVLAGYGITEATVGAPIEATMDVVQVGSLEDGTPVLLNRLALEADGVVLVNRIKPHTSFRGRYESGLMKMMTIGLGSHRGAAMAHAGGADRLARLIPAWGKVILDRAPILLGVALIENAYEQTARVVVLRPQEFTEQEPLLLQEARQAMPRLLVHGIDLLIVEEMGKDISGTGMDTNVIGRMMLPGVPEPAEPGIARIVVLDLTDRTHGNANGIGLADIVTRRLFERIDLQATYANVFTTTFLNRAHIPVIMGTDRDAIEGALRVQHLEDTSAARIVRIASTLELAHIEVSTPLYADFSQRPDLEATAAPRPLTFDADGRLQRLSPEG
jgi:hypothetical protein